MCGGFRTAGASSGSQWPRDDEFETHTWVALLPIHLLWVRGEPASAVARLDASASQAGDGRMAVALGMMNLAFGRTRAAEAAFAAMSANADEREPLLAFAAMARNDFPAARAHLVAGRDLFDRSHPVPNQAPILIWLLFRMGLKAEAQDLLARSSLAKSSWGLGERAAAVGDVVTAIRSLDAAMRDYPKGTAFRLRAAEGLGDLLVVKGDLQGAEHVLEVSEERAASYPGAGSTGYPWLRVRERLLGIERRLGHASRVASIERELRQLLGSADPDFEVLQNINRDQ